jgi:uncharacterized protein (TIGR02118 family)
MATVKVMVLISAKPGISAAQFRHHYETVHAPLALRLLPMIKEYRRNFFDRSVADRPGTIPIDFDVITELVFASEADYEAFTRRVAEPEVRRQIRADEANFLDSDKTRRLVVTECRSVV